jgi:hypothetical protein
MKRFVFTPQKLDGLPVLRGKQYYVSDIGAPGLCVHVSQGGTKSYKARFRYDGALAYLHLGHFGEVQPRDLDGELAEVRALAREARVQAKNGIDPRGKSAQRSVIFEEAMKAYTAYKISSDKGAKSAEVSERVMLAACKEWTKVPVGTITPVQIETLLDKVLTGDGVKRGTPYMANRLYAQLAGFFTWATKKRKLFPTSPMAGIDKPWEGEKERNFYWFKNSEADTAIREIWKAADTIGGDEGKYLKFCLLTGKRHAQQVKPMEWSEIDPTGFWNVPEARGSKRKRAESVPLSGLALRVLGPRGTGKVFTASMHATTLVSRVRKLTSLNRPGEEFILHGLKHVMKTKLRSLGVPVHITKLLLDHSTGSDPASRYDHHDYLPEMKEAVEKWAAYVTDLVHQSEAKVTVLR